MTKIRITKKMRQSLGRHTKKQHHMGWKRRAFDARSSYLGFHPSDVGPADLPETLPSIGVAFVAVQVCFAALVAYAVAIDVAAYLSTPHMENVEDASLFMFLNFDVLRGDPGDYHTNMANNCIQWAVSRLWRAVGLPDAAVTAISAGIVVVDIFPLRMPTSDSHGRLTPAKTYVALCGSVAAARKLSELYRDLIIAMLVLNCVARGKVVSIVTFGDSAELFVTKLIEPLPFVCILGRFMHPESLLALGGDIKKKIASGKFFCAATNRATYAAADAAVKAVVLLFGLGALPFDDNFHVGLYEGVGDVLGELAKLRSERMLGNTYFADFWASASPAEKKAHGDATATRWASKSPAEKQAHGDAISEGLLAFWASMSPAEKKAVGKRMSEGQAAMSPEAKAKLAATRRTNGLGRTHTAEAKAKIATAKVGNTNNTRPDTKHLPCPNPACAYRASYSMRSRDFKKHLAQCSACADVVRKALAKDDPEGVLLGWKPGCPTGWPKWLNPKKPKK